MEEKDIILNPLEHKILQLYSHGLSNGEIAKKLNMEPDVVEQMLEKMRVRLDGKLTF